MPTTAMSQVQTKLRDNLHRVRDRIAQAAESAGRLPSEITLVAVTKYVDAALAEQLFAVGQTELGENRPQELWVKAESPALAAARWHLVGHLQRNKVRRTLPLVALVHSVDSERLLKAIENEAVAVDRTVEVLLEVNTSGDVAKHGLGTEEVEPLFAAAEACRHVNVLGLMTMAAREGGPAVAQKNFAALRDLRDRLRPKAPECVSLDELSMGMSGDFEEAIAQGATIVRVGTLLWEGIDLAS